MSLMRISLTRGCTCKGTSNGTVFREHTCAVTSCLVTSSKFVVYVLKDTLGHILCIGSDVGALVHLLCRIVSVHA